MPFNAGTRSNRPRATSRIRRYTSDWLENSRLSPSVAIPIDIVANRRSATKRNEIPASCSPNRFAVMRYWREIANIPFNAFLSEDEHHMNDWS